MKARVIVVTVGAVAVIGYCATRQSAERDARAQADVIAVALEKHRVTTGAYPKQLREIGFDGEALRSKWNLVYRPTSSGDAPALFYSAQNNFLVAWHYDFAARKWVSQD